MKRIASVVLACVALFVAPERGVATPTVEESEYLGPFTGHDAKLHPANQSPHPIEYYGTDLGWSYEHAGVLHFLFGDTWATEAYAPIEASTGSRFDDGFGTVLRSEYPDAAAIAARRFPPIRLAQNPGSREMSAIDPGHVMDLGKTPLAGFSNGEREFGIFHLTKPQGCRIDSDCGEALTCETGLGFVGTRYDQQDGLTLVCAEGDAGCNADTMIDAAGKPLAGSGFCVDRTSTIWADTAAGKVSAAALHLRVGLRSLSDPRKYTDGKRWLTNKFVNLTARTDGTGADQRVLLWGRPGFVGVSAKQRTLGMYFAYADMPQASNFAWRLHYFAGTTAAGAPRFSAHEKDAVPLDLDSAVPGIQAAEIHDVVNQASVAWFAHLKKWVMFYGGGMTKRPTATLPRCGVLQLFAGRECEDVAIGNGAVRMRTSDQPWGPWSPPQDVVVGGDPSVAGSGQYGPGGALHHPACVAEGCATHSRMFAYHAEEYGFLYGVNIVEQWSYPAGAGVDVIWNASTWDPYRVVLMRTRVQPSPRSRTSTTVLGPFTGVGAPLHPRNERPHRIAYYGTDLGFSYEHGGKIHFLFGDTLANERGDVIEASTGTTFDDGFGTVDLAEWPDARGIGVGRMPPIELAQNAGTAEMSALNPGQALESFKTPLGGFSNGTREFALFYTSKPLGCQVDAECTNGLSCDTGLGFSGERYDKAEGFTLGCIDGTPGCNDDTMIDRAGAVVKGSGFCSDKTSSVWAQSDVGRLSGIAMTQLFRVRGTRDPRRYEGVPQWLTNKFANVTLRPVADFVPARGAGRRNQDYRNRDAAGPNRRVFLWGRPGFVGVGAKGRTLGLYFAYVDMPQDTQLSWNVRYFSGIDASGIPRFSASERDALALDLDAGQRGRQPAESHDIVNQMSVVWVESLGKWLMLYGGGTTRLPSAPLLNRCGILEFFTREECEDVRVGNGAIRMRTADDPWGPWSAPEDVIIGGDPNASPPRDQYAIGGMLRHPACTASGCAPHMSSPSMQQAEYGFLYGVNIVEPWITPVPDAVEVIWNASTWDPYRVILLKTRIARR